MANKESKNNNRLRSRYRFSIFNDTSHSELFVFRTSGLGAIVGAILVIIAIITSVIVLISFTSLRELIPGYPDTQTQRSIVANALKADSLDQVITQWEWYLSNMQRVLNNEDPVDLDLLFTTPSDSLGLPVKSRQGRSREDSLLRQDIVQQERFTTSSSRVSLQSLEGMLFFPPVKGVVSDNFNPATKHYAIDIAAVENAVVSAVLDGTVIWAGWTDDTGYVIHIQHDHNLISIYKHNAKLLKKSGDRVKAGDAIALVGNAGSLSTGSHLHFELWHNRAPVDPAQYITF
ncbi:MAG: M23 family metallopeptidase [Bacteroidetes bacterium]|nr:M23 family metallopeptidase [Bacteroidota bacterium]